MSMRYLDIDTAKKISAIGLGTWQFGSREWGYGDDYADRRPGASSAARSSWASRCSTPPRSTVRAQRADTRQGARRATGTSIFLATKILPVMPVAPVVEQRAVASASRLGARKLDLYQVHQPNPAGQGRHDHARHARAAARRAGRRGRRQQLLAAAAGSAAEAALGSRVLTNQVQYSLADREPERDLVPYAAGARPARHRLQPAGPGPAVRPLRRGQQAAEPGPGRTTRCSCRRTWNAPTA